MKSFIFIVCSFLFVTAFAVENANLPLRGQGNYKWLFLNIYEAKLWGEKTTDVYSKPLLLELKYLRDFKGKDIANQSAKELTSAGHSKSDVELWKERLLEIFPDVKEGDTIQASYYPDKGVTFYLNKTKELGKINDLNFSQKFLDIWLGKNTTAPDLRNKLLGEN